MDNEIYDGKFVGNILIVGRTACGKTFFTQKLAVNNFFGKLKKTEWVSYIKLTKEREAEIESCFACPVEFHYPQGQNDLKDFLDDFKQISKSDETDNKYNLNNIFGEKTTRDRLIIMDDVSGLADETKNFASFLTVARKYRYSCVYIFHTIFPEKAIRFQTEADNTEFQTFYFNSANDEQVYSEFVSKTINSAEDREKNYFKSTKLKSKTNKNVRLDATD